MVLAISKAADLAAKPRTASLAMRRGDPEALEARMFDPRRARQNLAQFRRRWRG